MCDTVTVEQQLVSRRIDIPGVEALRVRVRGAEVGLVLIDEAGLEQVVPVQLEPERASDVAA